MALLDVDRDGELSKEEMANAPTRLRLLDADNDGTVQNAEIAEFRPRRGIVEFDAATFVERVMKNDRNRDGRVVRSELPKGLKRLVAQADRDRDGALSRAEVEAAAKRLHDLEHQR